MQLKNPDNKYAGFVTYPNNTSNFLFFGYDYSGKGKIAIYSIDSNKLISINKISVVGKTLEISKNLFHIKQGNQFICFLPADLLVKEDTSTKANLQQAYGSYSDMNEILPFLIEDDNPIMVIGELNIDNLFSH